MQEDVIPTCRELGIGIVAYSPLGRGFLTGQIKSRDDLAGALSACTLGCLHVHWGLCKYFEHLSKVQPHARACSPFCMLLPKTSRRYITCD